jgi:hypothetical protein
MGRAGLQLRLLLDFVDSDGKQQALEKQLLRPPGRPGAHTVKWASPAMLIGSEILCAEARKDSCLPPRPLKDLHLCRGSLAALTSHRPTLLSEQ